MNQIPQRMRLKMLSLLICASCWCLHVYSQPTYNTIVKDTIITHREFLNRTYLLNGKPVTLPVMEWFMSDYPPAHDEIRVAVLCDQMSIAGYSVGSLFAMSGLFVYGQNEPLGQELIKVGLVGIGSGIVFQILAGSFKKSAVGIYNREVKEAYKKRHSAAFKIFYHADKVIVTIGF